MAAPKSRRPGFSRKAQYGLFVGYVAAFVGVIVAVLLLIAAAVDPSGFQALRGAALDATTPVSAGGRSVVRGIGGAGETIGDYFFAASKNAELRRQLESTEVRLVEARAIELENKRLKRLIGLAGENDAAVARARIVGSSFDSSRRLATLSAGSGDGVRIGQPVRAPEGLIGRVVDLGRFAARVLMVTDGASNVPVRLVRDGTPAIATGRGDGTLEIKPLEVGRNPFQRGDILVTSGVGGLYPPGIPVAIVATAARDTTIARPLANPARIDFAIVLPMFMPAAQAPLEPPPPAPSAQSNPPQPAATPAGP